MTNSPLKVMKIGFLGIGNMNQAILSALVQAGTVSNERIYVTNRSQGKLNRIAEQHNVRVLSSNEELIDTCDIVIVGVKPQDLEDALEPVASSFHPSQVVISLAAGVSLSSLQKMVPHVTNWVRVMPNIAAHIRQSVVGFCLSKEAKISQSLIEELLAPLGYTVRVEEGDEFEALTVSCGSGIGFVFELMLYWQEWLDEHGFSEETARKMIVQTFLGASMFVQKNEAVSIEELQRKVTSKKGVTQAGLDSMRELEIERALRYSFEKAVLRDRELGKM